MILIAHKEDCKIISIGESTRRHFATVDGEPWYETIKTPCTCGGVKVELIQGEPHSPGNFKAVIRMVD